MPHAILLGTGTSTGIPAVGRAYPPGYLDNPKNHRRRCACLLRSDEGDVLIDAGPDLRLQLTEQNVMDVEAVVISHTHADHIMGMDDLRTILLNGRETVPIYTLPRYQEDIRRVFPYAFEEFPPGIMVPRFDLRDAPSELRVAGFRIRLFTVWHGPWPVLGVRVGGMVYMTDVSEIPNEVWPELEGVDTLVLDAVRIRPHPNHFHLEAAIATARQIGAKRTLFTHLSDDFDHDADGAKLPSGMEFAYDGLTIELSG